ncbi:MAG: L-2-hydroxyglutarate oxidase [Acidobacteriota bacterium]|nr:L-2-hydroxyglutarate oxidase [Acidobacteriota bacterium]
MKTFDVAVVGGGIVGLATAWRLLEKDPRLSVVLLEKEGEAGAHQTGHNSGVIHSGLYYKPGSEKAKTCVEGGRLLLEFCRTYGVPYEICGKLVVATSEEELPRLDELARRGRENGVAGLRELGPEELRKIEPNAAGIKALHVPPTGITNYGVVARTLAAELSKKGVELRFLSRVTVLSSGGSEVRIVAGGQELAARHAVSCSGLHADRVARLDGVDAGVRIVPFRGEYYKLAPGREGLVKGLLYPVPDPRFPFLGVHFTRLVGGGAEAGPNAVPALAREGYTKTSFNLRDMWDEATYPGVWRLAAKHGGMALGELHRSFFKGAFVKALQKLMPGIRGEDLVAGGAGVRAQALRRDGTLEDDFVLAPHGRIVHVLNAPSPAATASLAIGDRIAARVLAMRG